MGVVISVAPKEMITLKFSATKTSSTTMSNAGCTMVKPGRGVEGDRWGGRRGSREDGRVWTMIWTNGRNFFAWQFWHHYHKDEVIHS